MSLIIRMGVVNVLHLENTIFSPKKIYNYLKSNGVNYLKKITAPLVEEKQLARIIKGARKLATKTFVEKNIVINQMM